MRSLAPEGLTSLANARISASVTGVTSFFTASSDDPGPTAAGRTISTACTPFAVSVLMKFRSRTSVTFGTSS